MAIDALAEEIERSADPTAAASLVERLGQGRDDAAQRIQEDAALRSALIAVGAASPWLSRVCATDARAIEVLADLDRPSWDQEEAGGPGGLGRAKSLEVLRIAARDLLGLDDLEAVGTNLSLLAEKVLQRAYEATVRTSGGVAVIGLGKLGATELNYASDVDVVIVSPDQAGIDVRPLLEIARTAWRVDLGLRPEGRAGQLARTLPSYIAYWERWAQTWEFQALLKARTVAGEHALGGLFTSEAARRVWEQRPFGADELRDVRDMKARAEQAVTRRGLEDRELKRGRGGIRDIEFAVQLLQLVHGRADASLRAAATIPALRALAVGGYVGTEDAGALEEAYGFLRRVEHRLQLYEDLQVHTVPSRRDARTHLARVLGYRDRAAETALSQFDSDLRRHQAAVRAIHERLFFRPLLEAFAATSGFGTGGSATISRDAVAERLAAFGFADAERTHQGVIALTRGFSRSSQLMQQSLPVLLDWLSASPNPDLGLLGLRTLATAGHNREQLTAVCRESPEAARQLCRLLGTGPRFARDLQHHPDALTTLAAGDFLVERGRGALEEHAEKSMAWRTGKSAVPQGLRLFARGEMLRIASRDVLDLDGVVSTGAALTDLAESVVAVALRHVRPSMSFAVIGMGRLGGREMAYGSDLDLMFVYDRAPGPAAAAEAESAAGALVTIIGGTTPATGLYRVDTGLRPEGRDGPMARSIESYDAYYQRWAQAWERQALLRGRFIAGDAELGERFEDLARQFVWGHPFAAQDAVEIRRTKARVERERVPAGDDPKFHLKLGPGSLSDVEWTAQLLQLQRGVRATGTLDALEALRDAGALDASDERILADAYLLCERTRNRLQLIREIPGDSLPSTGPALTVLARSLGTSPSALRDDYLRVTRRARRVFERLFYARLS